LVALFSTSTTPVTSVGIGIDSSHRASAGKPVLNQKSITYPNELMRCLRLRGAK
jgi:hypothetical protein